MSTNLFTTAQDVFIENAQQQNEFNAQLNALNLETIQIKFIKENGFNEYTVKGTHNNCLAFLKLFMHDFDDADLIQMINKA